MARCIRCHPLSGQPPAAHDTDTGSSAKPPWCGQCDERTRLRELPDGPIRCIRCHPLVAGHSL